MKRILPTLLALILGTATVLPGQWHENGEPAEDTHWRKMQEGFGAMLLLSPDPEGFLEQWNQPAAPDYEPTMVGADSVRRGDVLAAFVLFLGCTEGEDRRCSGTVDFVIRKPDGTEYASVPGLALWIDQESPREQALNLVAAHLKVIIEPEEPLGEYSFEARVCDSVAGICLDLIQPFQAQARLSEYERDAFFRDYYLEPRPEQVTTAMADLATSGLLADANVVPPMLGFFSEVFAANPDRLEAWTGTFAELDEAARKVFQQALILAENPATPPYPPSPSLNDYHWGAFSADGDTAHVDQLLEHAGHFTEREDLNTFLMAGTARWSLAGNARQHFRVRQHLESRRRTADPETQALIEKVLTQNLAAFRTEMIEVLQQQREKGVW